MNFDLETLMSAAEQLPEEVKANAIAHVEAMFTELDGVGDEPIRWKPSFMKVVQGTSNREKLPKGTAIGDIIVGENKVEQPLAVIPLRSWVGRQMWDPDQNNARMLCNSPDAKTGYIGLACRSCPNSQFDEETKKSACNKVISVLAVTADLKETFVVNFAKTNYMKGKDWSDMMTKAGVLPYRRQYKLSTETSKTAKNVEVLTAAKDGNTNEAHLEFLDILFKKHSADRKAHLEAFYEMIEERKTQKALSAPTFVEENTTPALEILPEEEGEIVEETKAKKYKF